MSKFLFSNTNWTPTATADTTALANATYQALGGGSSTQRLEVEEIYAAGMAGSSSPTFLMLARDSTVAGTPAALAAPAASGPLEPQATGLSTSPVTCTAATTPPQRSVATTTPRLHVGLNAFGGIVRWVAAPYERYIIYGTAVNVGEASLSAYTGGTVGAVNSHIVFEAI